MTTKEIIIDRISKKNNIDINIIEKIVSHQFDLAIDATNKHNSIEISGFGKFLFNEGKARKRLEKYESQIKTFNKLLEDDSLPEKKRRNYQMKLNTVIVNINHLNSKLATCQN